MNVELMRSEIAKAYPGDDWKKRVKRMSDEQVIAVYHSFLRNDKFKKHATNTINTVKEPHEPRQLTFDDILASR